MSLSQEAFGFLSVIFAIVAYPPYIRSMLRGETKPHVFTWIIWTLLTWIAFAIQVSGGGGAGSWATGVTGLFCLAITGLSFRHGEKEITRSDKLFFSAGLVGIPLWLLTKDLVLAALMVTVIDSSGFYPTFRKAWIRPHEEMIRTHLLSAGKHLLSLPAIAVVNIPTTLFPVTLVALNGALVLMIALRRRAIKP